MEQNSFLVVVVTLILGPFPGVDFIIDNITLLPTVIPECFNSAAEKSDVSSDDEIISVSINLYTGKRSRHIESVDTAVREIRASVDRCDFGDFFSQVSRSLALSQVTLLATTNLDGSRL